MSNRQVFVGATHMELRALASPHGRPRTTLRGNDTARHVHIRLSPDEYATLIARAKEARRTLADFIRAAALANS